MKRFAIRQVMSRLGKSESKFPIKVVFSDGSVYHNLPGEPEVIFIFKTRWSEWRTFFFAYVGFMEAYRDGDIDIEGRDALRKVTRMTYEVSAQNKGKMQIFNPLIVIRQTLLEWRQNNKSYLQEKINLYRHYNLPAEFFHLMTGSLYGYTEGYRETGLETQDEAQYKKYDYMCRKMCLKPGDKVIEVGTAWGTMALHMAKKYGAHVVNYGLVEGQNEVLLKRVKELGLEHKIQNVVRDCRELKHERERYDKYVSLGVFEHAGKDCQREWVEAIAACLKDGGIGVITFTGHMRHERLDYLIAKYIWFGCHLPSLAHVLELFEEYNLNVVDIENSRFHYADTMEVMLGKLLEHWPRIQHIDPKIFDEKFRRIWMVYYLGAIEALRSEGRTLHAFQLVFVKGRKDVYPRTRKFLYEEPYDTEAMADYAVPLDSDAANAR